MPNPYDLNQYADRDLAKPDEYTTTVNGTGVQVDLFTGVMKGTLSVGTVSGTSPTLDVKIQDSPDNSAWSDVTGYTYTQVIASTARESLAIDTRLVDKWIRAVFTITGTTPSFDAAVSLIALQNN